MRRHHKKLGSLYGRAAIGPRGQQSNKATPQGERYHQAKQPLAWTFIRFSTPSKAKKMGDLWANLVAKAVVVAAKIILSARVFPLSLGDLRMKCFNKLPTTSIKSFLQIFELFMARFVINTKAPKGVSSLMALCKGKNETLHNYNKWYWEFYNKIEECSKELVMISYKLRPTTIKKLWEDLTLNAPVDL
ncbi:hypothetical protein Acr_00g0026150 [Actinidia rufa]|uniref:Retrotransposon gag domain-containing protein n=1 Tax=Actinidia rufa TaxID=165716 RepID=A0A7J0DFF6_9ERIC|nr:hypothetical protein Acr_00g0026150 [Actinidia rufa]